jgi:hypothetical protein
MRRALALAAAFVCAALAPRAAFAEGIDVLPPRETADVLAPGQWETGVFNPLRLGFDSVELEVHPLVFFVAPHLDVRVPVVRADEPGGLRVTAVAGLAVPTAGFRNAMPFGVAGDLVPSCKVAADDPSRASTCDAPPWVVVPKVGASASMGLFVDEGVERGVLTVRAELAKGIPWSGEAARPLDAWAPVAVKLAPALGQLRAEARVAYDHALLDWLRARAELGAHFTSRPADDPLSPWYTSAYLGVDVRTTEHTRVTLGGVWWTADKHERVVETGEDGYATVSYVRSHELWPTIDFLWRY